MEGRGTEPGTRWLLGSTANGLKCSSQILLLPYSVDEANPNKLGFPKEIRHFHQVQRLAYDIKNLRNYKIDLDGYVDIDIDLSRII